MFDECVPCLLAGAVTQRSRRLRTRTPVPIWCYRVYFACDQDRYYVTYQPNKTAAVRSARRNARQAFQVRGDLTVVRIQRHCRGGRPRTVDLKVIQ